jgi:hypothetical protein
VKSTAAPVSLHLRFRIVSVTLVARGNGVCPTREVGELSAGLLPLVSDGDDARRARCLGVPQNPEEYEKRVCQIEGGQVGDMDSDYTLRRAAELGLEKLADLQLSDVQAALKNAKAMAARLPDDFHWTEEPAHTFSRVPRRMVRT